MALWTAQDLSQALGISTIPSALDVSGVSIDTRTLTLGDLFIAIKGDAGDGHDYVQKAFEAGAKAAIVDRPIEGVSGTLIQVEDTLKALWQLGSYRRSQSEARIAAITGSVGKTTVKDWLRQICQVFGQADYSVQSYNNKWGVPLSLARMRKDSAYGVFEVGMNNPGEIEPLANLIQPEVAIITTIAEAHVGNMINLEGIVEEKANILSGVTLGGAAILNRDSNHFEYLADIAKSKGIHRVLGFGEDARSDIRLLSFEGDGDACRVTASIDGTEFSYTLPIPGKHSAINSLIILATAKIWEFDMKKTVEAFASLKPLAGRGEQHTLTINGQTITLIDDAYNANPTSMRAGLSILAKKSGRKIAILGEMGELGDTAQQMHEEISGDVLNAGVDLVFASGELMQHLYNKLPPQLQGAYKSSAQELIDPIKQALRTGDQLLVKGSNASLVSHVVQALLEASDQNPNRNVA